MTARKKPKKRVYRRTLPKYKPGPFVRASAVDKDYRALAKQYLKEARANEAFVHRLRNGIPDPNYKPEPWMYKKLPASNPLVRRYQAQAKRLRHLAEQALERAKRHRGVYSRDTSAKRHIWKLGDQVETSGGEFDVGRVTDIMTVGRGTEQRVLVRWKYAGESYWEDADKLRVHRGALPRRDPGSQKSKRYTMSDIRSAAKRAGSPDFGWWGVQHKHKNDIDILNFWGPYHGPGGLYFLVRKGKSTTLPVHVKKVRLEPFKITTVESFRRLNDAKKHARLFAEGKASSTIRSDNWK